VRLVNGRRYLLSARVGLGHAISRSAAASKNVGAARIYPYEPAACCFLYLSDTVIAMSEALGARLRRTDERTALAVITSAFGDDPVERWLYPDESYQQQFPAFARALGGKAFDAGTAWCSDDEAAVALWLPPGVTPDDEAVVDALTATVAMAKHEDMYVALEQMEQAHPKDPHWYLAWLAVERSAQGRGLGTTLLARCLATVDASHQPAYLETPNPRTVRLYERHGFERVGNTYGGSCPPITFMLRPAR
jgi:ribosomal protein S18 acetylase RimI-like enzyme